MERIAYRPYSYPTCAPVGLTIGTHPGGAMSPQLEPNTLGPIIRESIPLSTPVFTDEGYKWLWGIYRNHRAVNHSLKSKDNRWRFSRQRWCRNGVHNQVAEGLNSSLKSAMTAYRYFRPEYSPLYLSEWAFFKNLKYFGLERIRSCVASGPVRNSGISRGAVGGRGITPRVTPLLPTIPLQTQSNSSTPSTRTSTSKSQIKS